MNARTHTQSQALENVPGNVACCGNLFEETKHYLSIEWKSFAVARTERVKWRACERRRRMQAGGHSHNSHGKVHISSLYDCWLLLGILFSRHLRTSGKEKSESNRLGPTNVAVLRRKRNASKGMAEM